MITRILIDDWLSISGTESTIQIVERVVHKREALAGQRIWTIWHFWK